MKQLFKINRMSGTSRTFCLLPIGATGSQLPDHPHATRNCNRSRKSLHPQEQCENSLSGRKREDATQRKFLADYLKTATGKDFAIEAGTEGKNAIVLALGTENENPESYQLKVTGDRNHDYWSYGSRRILWHPVPAQIIACGCRCETFPCPL